MNWEQIWTDHWEELYTYIYFKIRGGRQEAEDLTQDTFIRLIRSGQQYESSIIVGVLKRTALRLIIDRWRKGRNRAPSMSINEEILNDGGRFDPEVRVIRDELIREALDALKADQRQVIVLRLIQGFSVKETAELTGKSEASVRTLQFRAIRTVQKKLGIDGEEGEKSP